MSDSLIHPNAALSVEDGVNVLLSNAAEEIRKRHQRCENQIRKSPTTAMLGAIAIGYLLRRMPLRTILIASVRVLWALTPPALVVFGMVKLFSFLQKQKLTNDR